MNIPQVGRMVQRAGSDGAGRRLDRRAAAVPPASPPAAGRDLDGPNAVVLVIGETTEARKVIV